jgi:uncharacterized protein
MNETQAIANPFGITVFGSAISRVTPDVAVIRASVAHIEQKPGDAFAKVKRDAKAVQNFLHRVPQAEFGASRAALTPQHRYVSNEQRFVGYQAKVSFRILLSVLERSDEVAEALVANGVNEIESITFETTKLRDVRQAARRLAITAAMDKASNYCAAAGVILGDVLHIEDVNPQSLQGREGHNFRSPPTNDDSDIRALDPSQIEIGAAVLVAYRFAPAQ